MAKQNSSCHQTIYLTKCIIVKWSNICSMQAYKLNNYANESYLEPFLHHSCDKYWTFTINRQICTYVNNCTIVVKCQKYSLLYCKTFYYSLQTELCTDKSLKVCIPLKPLETIGAKLLADAHWLLNWLPERMLD